MTKADLQTELKGLPEKEELASLQSGARGVFARKLTVNGSRDVSFIDPGNSPKTPLEFENCC